MIPICFILCFYQTGRKEGYLLFEKYSDLLTIGDMQNALGIGRTLAYRLINDGHIGHIRVGKSIKVPKKLLIEYVEASCYNSPVVAKSAVIKEEK